MAGGKRTGAGRKPVHIDLEQVEKLAAIQCTEEEIAAFLGVSLRPLNDASSSLRLPKLWHAAKRRDGFRCGATCGHSPTKETPPPTFSSPRICWATRITFRTNTAAPMAVQSRSRRHPNWRNLAMKNSNNLSSWLTKPNLLINLERELAERSLTSSCAKLGTSSSHRRCLSPAGTSKRSSFISKQSLSAKSAIC